MTQKMTWNSIKSKGWRIWRLGEDCNEIVDYLNLDKKFWTKYREGKYYMIDIYIRPNTAGNGTIQKQKRIKKKKA